MSVAFRRESDEDHKEPRFELPIPAGPNLVTPAGAALIEDRIAGLEAALAGADGDHAEALRRDLRYWQTRRSTARITPAPADGTAGFATRVRFTLAGRPRTIEIVGDDEAEPASGRIAWSAPLARAVSGLEPGETAPFQGRDDAIEILAVEPL